MELETDFLSCNLANSPPKSDLKDEQKLKFKDKVLTKFISGLYSKLCESGEESFCLPLDDMNCFLFQYKHTPPTPPKMLQEIEFEWLSFEHQQTLKTTKPVQENEVPYFTEPHLQMELKLVIFTNENLLLRRIIDYINGKFTAKQISALSNTNINYVKEAI